MSQPAVGTVPRRLGTDDYTTLAEFRYLLRQFGAFSEEAARAAGLTVQQHQALLAIKGFPGRDQVTVGELAERLNLKHHTRCRTSGPPGGARSDTPRAR